MKKFVIYLLATGIIFPFFAAAYGSPIEQSNPEAPKNIEELKKGTEEFAEAAQKEMPGFLEKSWKEKVLPAWKRIFSWIKENTWDKIIGFLEEGIEEKIKNKKPAIEEELEKEKEEIKEEGAGKGKSLWERFKEIIK